MDRRIKKKTLDKIEGRTIAISDIHGNFKGLMQLLQKIHYQPHNDRLILVGDLIEKGSENLALARWFVQHPEVEAVMGNCDFVCRNILYSYNLDFIHRILLKKPASLITEMAREIGMHIDQETDMEVLSFQLRQHFMPILKRFNQLPTILEDDHALYVHAGLDSLENPGQLIRDCINRSLFLLEKRYFKKPVVVGHMPVSEYCVQIGDDSIRYEASMNVYAIDGGNQVKEHGQLNALIFHHHQVSTAYYCSAKTARVIRDVKVDNPAPLFLNWHDGYVDVMMEKENYLYVYSPKLHRYFWLPKAFYQNGKASEYTNYHLPLKQNDLVYVLKTFLDQALIKKEGQIGLTHLSNLQFDANE